MSLAEPAKTPTRSCTVHVFGVRHHGPGSARSLRKALEALEPDAILLEGPPDADELLPLLADAELTPPVALLVYRPEQPKSAVYHPFALFSPEWQAICHAREHSIPIRFMDLPVAHHLAREAEAEASEAPTKLPGEEGAESASIAERVRIDPLQVLAEAAGFGDGEEWWEHAVEHRRDGADLFAAILEAMREVRASVPPLDDERELRREAHMRQTIRAEQAAGRTRIAVVCGAWHAPALAPDAWPKVKDDAALLKRLPKTKVTATWVPWTHGRLSVKSGYGAGVTSPGWYHHLWTAPDQVVTRWMTRVARLLRESGLDASSASVIEAVRLAETLTSLRGRPLPGLAELNEAVRTVFCFGDETPMRLIERKLIVGETLGQVPDVVPMVPLQQDLTRLQKRLKLPASPAQSVKLLDLREPTDLERSRLLHRLNLLSIPWGGLQQASGKGTFKEAWQLQWHPEFAVSLIEASLWGATVIDAAVARASHLAEQATSLPGLTELLDSAILADLPAAVAAIMERVEAQAALASDVSQLMSALPPLARLLRYGNVRQTDAAMVAHAAGGMTTRVCIGLPNACASLDDAAAASMFTAIMAAHEAIGLIHDAAHLEAWHEALVHLADAPALHRLIAGRACRLLLEAQVFGPDEVARRMSLAVSPASEPPHAAAWVEGFLQGSGELLYYDEALFAIFDGWLAALSPDAFPELLPLLRRTFASFEPPLRRNLGEKAKRGHPGAVAPTSSVAGEFDHDRAGMVLPLVRQLLGLDTAPEGRAKP